MEREKYKILSILIVLVIFCDCTDFVFDYWNLIFGPLSGDSAAAPMCHKVLGNEMGSKKGLLRTLIKNLNFGNFCSGNF